MTSLFLSLFFGTFILEDVALASGIALAAQGQIGWMASFMACALGIAAGDLILYAVGIYASRSATFYNSRLFSGVKNKISMQPRNSLFGIMIVVSRLIPGTRLPTYILAGYLGYSFLNFFILTCLSVLAWVALTFAFGQSLQSLIAQWGWMSFVGLLVFFAIFRFFYKNLSRAWSRKAFWHSWRRWLYFEFWPAWLFYIPIVGFYIFHALRRGSFMLPFYANPQIHHAGLIGESKWDFLKHIADNEFRLKTYFIPAGQARQRIDSILTKESISYPFILKPDEGQRGFAVRIIRSDSDLEGYLKEAQFNLILQEYCDWGFEAGVFYYRLPGEPTGHIFSITDKEFPFVVGNGKQNLGKLILADKRARIIASVYFSRFQDQLERVPLAGEAVTIATCGNHCQGAIFKNGAHLNSAELKQSIESLAQNIPDFYFGRFDVRYRSPSLFKQGQGFKIVEINGAGSEATHIWDPKTKLMEAYRVLFRQWGLLFLIGEMVKKQKIEHKEISLRSFFRDLFKFRQQNQKLSVSS